MMHGLRRARAGAFGYARRATSQRRRKLVDATRHTPTKQRRATIAIFIGRLAACSARATKVSLVGSATPPRNNSNEEITCAGRAPHLRRARPPAMMPIGVATTALVAESSPRSAKSGAILSRWAHVAGSLSLLRGRAARLAFKMPREPHLATRRSISSPAARHGTDKPLVPAQGAMHRRNGPPQAGARSRGTCLISGIVRKILKPHFFTLFLLSPYISTWLDATRWLPRDARGGSISAHRPPSPAQPPHRARRQAVTEARISHSAPATPAFQSSIRCPAAPFHRRWAEIHRHTRH